MSRLRQNWPETLLPPVPSKHLMLYSRAGMMVAGLLIFFVSSGWSDPLISERLYLRKVVFEPANQKRAVEIPPGTPIEEGLAGQVANAVRNQLINEGHKDAEVKGEIVPVGVRQADLVIRINPGERQDIHKVEFSGNLNAKPKDLEKALQATRVRRIIPGIKRRPPLSEAGIAYDTERLKSYYLARGFFDAKVESNPNLNGEKPVLSYSIDSGRKYVVTGVKLSGAMDGFLSPGRAGEFPSRELCRCLIDFRRDAGRQGRIDFNPRVEVRVGENGKATLTANVETGPQYTIGRIEFRGNHSVKDNTIRRALVVDEGALFDPEQVLRSLARINRLKLFEPVGPGDVAVARNTETNSADLIISLRQQKKGRWAVSGPLGPPTLTGPLHAMIGSRLPGWGHGILEASTYYMTLGISAFSNPVLRMVPFAGGAASWIPLFGLERPIMPGQEWTSGFYLSPQLGLRGMGMGYAFSQANRGIRTLLRADNTELQGLIIPIEKIDGDGTVRVGNLVCDPEKPRLHWLRTVALVGSDLFLGFRPF